MFLLSQPIVLLLELSSTHPAFPTCMNASHTDNFLMFVACMNNFIQYLTLYPELP